jgi:hypothetical protein
VPFTPVAVRADVDEGYVRIAVIALAQGLDERLKLLEKDRIIPGLWDDLLAGWRSGVGNCKWGRPGVKDPFGRVSRRTFALPFTPEALRVSEEKVIAS